MKVDHILNKEYVPWVQKIFINLLRSNPTHLPKANQIPS